MVERQLYFLTLVRKINKVNIKLKARRSQKRRLGLRDILESWWDHLIHEFRAVKVLCLILCGHTMVSWGVAKTSLMTNQ